jgi:ubiquitin-protein ligase
MSTNISPTTLTSQTVKRLIKDVKDINNNPLHSNGIYYKHSDDDILKASALIIGPTSTPYEYGFYLFKIQYPTDYPHSPPTLTYCTNDGNTRFNPNLYKCGKVCISILNTWSGEQWNACQSISSVLLVLCTILNDKPLLNEPGIAETHRDFNIYNEIIEYKNYDVAICYNLESDFIKRNFPEFITIIQDEFKKNYNDIKNKLSKKKTNKKILQTTIYHMSITINYLNIINRIDSIYEKLK